MKSIINNYQTLNVIGAILWVIGFILGITGIYPLAFIGIIIGPIILITGITGWIVYYKNKFERFPNPIRSFKITLNKYKGIFALHKAMFDFLFSHVLHFWTFCILFWILLAFMGSTTMKSSKTFDYATNYLEKNDSLKMEIGNIKYYGLFIEGIANGDGTGKLYFNVIGEKKTVDAQIRIDKLEGKETVTEFIYK